VNGLPPIPEALLVLTPTLNTPLKPQFNICDTFYCQKMTLTRWNLLMFGTVPPPYP
jgi:hypothetical protein